ncbi:hypothetical protein, partial [Escherichia sp. 14.0982]|uniref:hypothetical protein n=1 Tax=Escherichia sp. 14.0982 TaxID=2723300 RepID=UPI001A928724
IVSGRGIPALSVGRIRRLRRIRQWCQMPDATLAASYQAYKFPHHPATMPMPDATLTASYQAYSSSVQNSNYT